MILEKSVFIALTLFITFFGLYVLKITYITLTTPIHHNLKIIPCVLAITMWVFVILSWIDTYKVLKYE